MNSAKSVLEGIERSSINGLLVARRLAQFCPTSLSLDDFKLEANTNIDNNNTNNIKNRDLGFYKNEHKTEYLPPNPVVKIENPKTSKVVPSAYPNTNTNSNSSSSEFALGIESPKHRFAFLIPDIKPIEKEKVDNCMKTNNNYIKMKYELPNLKQISICGSPPMRKLKPIKIVSFRAKKDENNTNNVNSASFVANESKCISTDPNVNGCLKSISFSENNNYFRNI